MVGTGVGMGSEDTWGSTRIGQKAEGEEGTMDRNLYCGFQGEEWARQTTQFKDWLV